MSRYPNVRFVLISPEELRVPESVRTDLLEKNGIDYEETTSLEEAMPQLDILYMTRVQRERFFNEDDYVRLKDSYILTRTSFGQPSGIWPFCTRCLVSMRFPLPLTTIPGPAISDKFSVGSSSEWR